MVFKWCRRRVYVYMGHIAADAFGSSCRDYCLHRQFGISITAMVKCVVKGCRNRQGKDPVRFYCIPTAIKHQCAKTRDFSAVRRAEWIARINREEITDVTVSRHTRVCSHHFVRGYPCDLFDLNNDDWAPSCKLGYENPFPPQIGSPGLSLQQLQSRHENTKLSTKNGRDPLPEDIVMVECDQEFSSHNSDSWEEHAVIQESMIESSEYVMEEDPLQESSSVIECKKETSEEAIVEDCVEDDVLSGGCKVKSFKYVVLKRLSDDDTLNSDCGIEPFGCEMVEHSSPERILSGDCKVEQSEHINSPQEDPSVVKCKVEQSENYVAEDLLQDGASIQECKIETYDHVLIEESLQKDSSSDVFEGISPAETCNVRFDNTQDLEQNTTEIIDENPSSLRQNSEYSNIEEIRKIAVKLGEPRKNLRCRLYDIHNCCKNFEELKREKLALFQELESVKCFLSEQLAERNLNLAKKDIKIKELESQIARLETLKGTGSAKKPISFCAESFMGDDNKVIYYTGLPTFGILFKAFNIFSKKVDSNKGCALPKFEQFVMVLLWLRLGLEERDLAYRFGVCQATVSRTLHKWLTLMSLSLDTDNFVAWPDRERLESAMPLWFKRNSKTSVLIIVSCFEVFIKTPGQNKANKSLKFLVATSPHRRILFVSKSWASGSSDKHITEHCGLLEKLLPGDILMADGGFDGCAGVGMCAKQIIPTSTPGKYQLSDHEVTGQFTNVDIEPLTELLLYRKFKILASNLPFEFSTTKSGEELSTLDHIVRVCCGLSNFWSPIAPKLKHADSGCSKDMP